MIIKITNNGLNDTIEKYIITKTKCKPPNSYQKLKNKTVSKIVNSIHNKFGIKINERIIISINSSYMKDYIVKHYNNLYKYESQILENYPTTDILDLSKTFDLSPVTIFKMVFERKYNMKLSNIIKNKNLVLDKYDKEQFDKAINYDIYFQLDQTKSQDDAAKFEKQIEEFLIKNKIEYLTQEQLAKEQLSSTGKVTNTPDFLIKSELVINNRKINWIDAKNFYGANIDFIRNKIKKQIKKYIDEYGSGCIIFSLGYNSKLNIMNTLCVDYQQLLA
jgi:hypothetical protein